MTVFVAGCSANSGAEAMSTESAPTASSSTAAVVADDAVCAGFSDVMTIVENADIGVGDGRMERQEQQGWYGIATRVLDRLPSGRDGAVSHAIADLRRIAPAVAPGSGMEAVGIGSAEWHGATEALAAACRDAGVELAIGVFTGGMTQAFHHRRYRVSCRLCFRC
nr:hypothetical protein DA06_19165 [Georgenia sp. SUBG003]